MSRPRRVARAPDPVLFAELLALIEGGRLLSAGRLVLGSHVPRATWVVEPWPSGSIWLVCR